MKTRYFLLVFCCYLLGNCFYANAQYIQVNQYFTLVKTNQGTLKGTLQEVTDSTVHILNSHGEAVIPYQIIEKIVVKKFSRTQMLAQQDSVHIKKSAPNEQIQYDHSKSVAITGMVIGQVANAVAFGTNDRDTYYTASAISIATPLLGFIFKDAFSSIDKFVIKRNLKKFALCKPELEIYSIKYQVHY